MITELGALAGIVKTLLEATKSGVDLFGGKARKQAAASAVQAQARLAGIAEQLYQSLTLSKMLPVWLKEHASFDLYHNNLNSEEVKLLDSRLRGLITDSVHDHFSSTIFRTNFSILPGIENALKGFRERLLALESQLNGIPAGSVKSWQLSWPILKIRMDDLRKEALKIDNLSDEIHSHLVNELREAAKQSVK